MSSQFNVFQTLLGPSSRPSHLVTLPPSLVRIHQTKTQLTHHPSNLPKSKTCLATPRHASPRLMARRRYHRNPNPHNPAPVFSSNNLEPQQQQQQRLQQSFHIASHRIARILQLSTTVKSALPGRQKGCVPRREVPVASMLSKRKVLR